MFLILNVLLNIKGLCYIKKKDWLKGVKIKKKGILNGELNALIGRLGHGDCIIVCDAAFPVPLGANEIDLAIEKDSPNILRILELLSDELFIEKIHVPKEMKEYNPRLYQNIQQLFSNLTVDFGEVPYKVISEETTKITKAIIRTGSFEPYGEVVLFTAVNAEEWFLKDGVKIPEHYKERLKKNLK